ncbi:MAG: ABC transporter ATP-binding protein [Candidatus Heimdallarchaeota archaeon]
MVRRTIITARGLVKFYGLVIGINEIDIDIKQGITALLGPNGAGKTTLLKIICGFLKPQKGEARVFDMPIWNNTELKRRIGYVPEVEGLYSWMTGEQFVTRMVELHGLSGMAAKGAAIEALKRFDLYESRNRKIGGYSKGMRQRVNLAQAIAHDPELFILDEPLASMDPIGRVKTIRYIHELARDGKSVLVSSHILHEVEQMSRELVLISRGRILASGFLQEIHEILDARSYMVSVEVSEEDRLRVRELGKALLDLSSVNFVRIGDNQVLIQTSDPNTFHLDLLKVAIEGGFHLRRIASPDESLEAIFEKLTSNHIVRRGGDQ